MAFAFSPASLVNLHSVHPDLQKLAIRALQLSPIDFAIIEGLRTEEEEQKCIASGKSETTHSRHLTGDAIDFMAIVGGKGTWEPGPYHVIAEAFRKAAVELGIAIEWGACWTHRLNNYSSADAARAAYQAERKAQGKSCFADLDHIQLDPKIYP